MSEPTEPKKDLEITEAKAESVVATRQIAISRLSDEQLNRKLARRLGWKESFVGNPPRKTWWHDDLGDGPHLDYCKLFGRLYAGVILEALES